MSTHRQLESSRFSSDLMFNDFNLDLISGLCEIVLRWIHITLFFFYCCFFFKKHYVFHVSGAHDVRIPVRRSYLALFHGLHDDLFQPGGLLLISGNPCEQHSVIKSFKANTVHQNWLMCGLPVGHMTTVHVITGSYDLSELLSLWNVKQHGFLSQTWKHLSVKLKCLIWCFHSRHSDSLHWSSSVMVTHSNLKMHWSLPLAVPDYIQIIQVSGKLCKLKCYVYRYHYNLTDHFDRQTRPMTTSVTLSCV